MKIESFTLDGPNEIFQAQSVSEIGSKRQWISSLTKAPHSCSSPLCWRWRGHERPDWWRLGGDVAGALSSPTLPPHHPGPDTGHGLHRQWSPVSSITALVPSCSPPRTGSPPRNPTGYQCSVTMHSLMTPSCQPRTRQPISGQCVAAGPIGWRVYEAAWRINTSVERGEALVAVPASTAAHWSCDDSYWEPRETNGIYVL